MQGTIVDRIDYNIQNVSASVEEGLKQLEKVSLSLSFFTYRIWLMLVHMYLSYNVCLFGFAGRENTKTRGDGDVCLSTRYHVFCNASPSDPEGDSFLMNNNKSKIISSSSLVAGLPFLLLYNEEYAATTLWKIATLVC